MIPNIYAKSELSEEKIQDKLDRGTDGIEIQLLSDFITKDDVLEKYDVEKFKKMKIVGIHAPLPLKKDEDIFDYQNIENLVEKNSSKLWNDICLLANSLSTKEIPTIYIVLHTELSLHCGNNNNETVKHITNEIKKMLDKYEHIIFLFENIMPLEFDKTGFIINRNNFIDDNVLLVDELIKQLGKKYSTRVGTVLDICHAQSTIKYLKEIKRIFKKELNIKNNLKSYFKRNPYIQIIHLNKAKGYGFGENHGLGYKITNSKDMKKLEQICKYHQIYTKNAAMCLEVKEDDYLNCVNYSNTKEALHSCFHNL